MQLNWCRTDAKSVTPQGYSPNFSSLVPIHSPGLREVSCPRTKHNVHGQHSNPDRSFRRTLGETCNSRRRSFQFWELKFLINDKSDHVAWKEPIYPMYYGQWLVGSLGAPSSEWSENINPYPNLPKGAHPKFYFQTRFGILWEQKSHLYVSDSI